MESISLQKAVFIQLGYQTRSRIIENKKGSHKIIQPKDFNKYHHLHYDTLTSIIPERKPEIYTVQKGDILFQARGLDHFSYYIKENLQNTLAASSFYILRLNSKKLLPEFLYWWLNQQPAQNYFKSKAGISGISFISKSALSQLKIQIPPMNIQKSIIKVINLWQQEKRLHEKYVKTKSKFIQTLCLNSIRNFREN